MVLDGFRRFWEGLEGFGKGWDGWGGHLITPLGLRVTEAAGIRLSTRKVYKVDTLEGKLAGLVHPDVESADPSLEEVSGV